MKRFIERLEGPKMDLKAGTLRGSYYPKHRLFVLGVYGGKETFQGTDRLSMAVQPDAVRFLAEAARREDLGESSFLFEGDRLFNVSFLSDALELGYDVRVLVLKASERTLTRRHMDRGDNQSEQFKASRKTKVRNVLESLSGRAPAEVFSNETTEEADALLERLSSELLREASLCR